MEYYDIDKNSQFLVSQNLLIVDDQKLLVLRHSDDPLNNEYGGYWVLPGGLLEFGEDLLDSLRREVKEETNLDVKVGDIVAAGSFQVEKFVLKDGRIMKSRIIRLSYLSRDFEGSVRLGGDGEHDKFKWAGVDEVRKFETFSGTQPAFDWFIRNY